MKASYLILARFAEFDSNHKLNLIGGETRYYAAESFPHVLSSIMGATKILFERDEALTSHSFNSIITTENPDEIVAEGESVEIASKVLPENTKFLAVAVVMSFIGAIIPEKGRYLVRVRIDGEDIASCSFRVGPASEEVEPFDLS